MRRVLEEEELDRLLPVVLPGAITEDELQAQAREQEEEEAARLAQDLSRCSDKVLRLRARISRRIGVVDVAVPTEVHAQHCSSCMASMADASAGSSRVRAQTAAVHKESMDEIRRECESERESVSVSERQRERETWSECEYERASESVRAFEHARDRVTMSESLSLRHRCASETQ
eukprot:76755-Rhodomonas_salina.1